MKRAFGLLVMSAFVGLIGAGVASATSMSLGAFEETVQAPTATVDDEVQSFEINPLFDDDKNVIGYEVSQQTLFFEGGDTVSSTGATFALFDPVITAAIGVVDVGTPSSFAVSVAAPLVPPITTLAAGLLSISGSFSDGAADGGSATPWLTSLIAQATVEGTGVADAGPLKIFAPISDTYGPYNVPYNFDCTALGDGKCDSFDLLVSFTGSGGNDAISFTARHEINPIPEPATAVLLGLGSLGAAFVTRKRRS